MATGTRTDPKEKTTAKTPRKAQRPKSAGRTRTQRPYPAVPLQEALALGEAIQRYAAGEKVRRLTLFKQMDRSPMSSSTKMLITNSNKYGISEGSYAADWLSLTPDGKQATGPDVLQREKLQARFKLAFEGIEPFAILYTEYKGKKLPSHEVMKDFLIDSGVSPESAGECIDTFIVNSRFLGLLQTVAGSEMLMPIEAVVEGIPETTETATPQIPAPSPRSGTAGEGAPSAATQRVAWSKICFFVTPIGDEGSEERRHSDMFQNSLIEPALKDFGMEVVRADQIGTPGMITSQVLEHLMRARLVIVDMSWHNPNAFYEMAIRHACKLPVIQIIRKSDRLPFDVNQVRTIILDTSDIYAMVPKLETYRSEIATQARAALSSPDDAATNPITVFFPGFSVTIPKEK